MNYYSHHIGDFRSGTVYMSRLERWIYRDMIELYYDLEGAFPKEVDAVCKKIGVRDDVEQLSNVVYAVIGLVRRHAVAEPVCCQSPGRHF